MKESGGSRVAYSVFVGRVFKPVRRGLVLFGRVENPSYGLAYARLATRYVMRMYSTLQV